MKVALIVQRFPHGGAESYVEQIAQRLYAKGENVTVISSINKDCNDKNYPFSIIRLSKLFSIGEYSFWRGLGNSLKKGNFDLIHINTYGYFHSDYVAFQKRKFHYKLVMTSHGFAGVELHKLKKNKKIKKSSSFDALRPFYDEKIGKRTILKCDHLIALSKRDVDLYKDIGVEESKITLIPPGIRDSFFLTSINDTKMRSALDADPVLLSIGELSWIKSQDIPIRAMPLILKEKPHAKLFLIGRDRTELQYLKGLCNKLGIEKNVTFLGFKNDDEVRNYMHSSDLLLHTSIAEGLSTVLLESMACGLPFVTTPAGGNGYLAEESNAGMIVPFDDPSTLANTVIELIDDKKKMQNLALNGCVYAKDLAWDKVFQRITNVYTKLLNNDKN